MNKAGMIIRTAFGNKKRIPIKHSITAKIINNGSNHWLPNVFVTKLSANGLAGLIPINLINPNQKKTIKKAIRASGI